MALSTEKAEKFTEYLAEDLERAKKIFALPLSYVVNQIKNDGMDYTEEEFKNRITEQINNILERYHKGDYKKLIEELFSKKLIKI